MRKKPHLPGDFDPVLSLATVCSLLAGVHEDTLFSWVRAGTLPPPIKLSSKTVGWRRSVIERFIEERTEAESEGA